MAKNFTRGVVLMASLLLALPPMPALGQTVAPAPVAQAETDQFNTEQLDAMLAPIALYPDELLTQILMASTYPLQIVSAARWLQKDDNKNLKGDALMKALGSQNWDPSVKSLIPFPQVLSLLNDNLEWTQQLGYAMANQQSDVLDAIQRLRKQAQVAGNLDSNEQQRVVVQEQKIVIEPTNTETVYVPIYNPSEVYGTWPYSSYPPVYFPPYPAYPIAYGVATGLAFAAGAAIVGGLWGWARPGWGYGNVAVNPLRYNNINGNRAAISSSTWRPPAAGSAGGRPGRPPGGPVGAPARRVQLPANAIGRANVQVPASAVNRPQISARGAGQNRPAAAAQHPSAGQRPAASQRPAAGRLSSGAQRPAAAQPPAGGGRAQGGSQRPAGAFGGLSEGNRASQFGARGAQSRGFQQGSIAARGGGGGFQGRAGGGGGGRGGRR